MTPEELIQRAERARQIVDDPLFAEAWAAMERGAIEKIAAADVTRVDQLARLTLALQTIRGVRAVMRAWIAEGEEAAKREAKRQSEPPTFLSRFRRA